MSERIAIDAGHGFTKALADDAQMIFPSLICPAPATVDLGEFVQSHTVAIDGVPYLVGEAARKHATPLWSRDKAADPHTLRLVLVAAAQLGAMGPVALATGLPLSWFGSQRRRFREALRGYGASVQLPGQAAQRLWIESVMVLPQGVAAAGPVLSSVDYAPGAYLIVDIGYRTTDYILVTKAPHDTLDYAPDAAGSLPVGMSAVTKTVVDAINRQYPVEYTPAEIESQTTVTVRGQHIDVTQRRRETQTSVGKQIAQQLALALGPNLDKLLGIVAVDGGSSLLTQVLPGLIVPHDPQWANVQGYAAVQSGS